MLVSLKPLMEDAMKKGYAVGAFNCPNMESVMAMSDKFRGELKLVMC